MKLCCTLLVVCSMLFGQILYEEHFTGGNMQLDWNPWVVDGDSMEVISDPTTPGGDGWAGKLTNTGAGGTGPSSLTYAGPQNLDDYSMESWIYTIVTPGGMPGPYNGIVIRFDTTANAFYSLVADFDNVAPAPQLRLRMIQGATPTVIRDWTAAEIPGGVPATSSWHKFKLKMIADSIWAYYDDSLLVDCPFIDNTIAQGSFGIYTFNVIAPVDTKCDDIIIAGPVGIDEHGSQTASTVTIYPNPFRSAVTMRFSTQNVTLRIYDASGRLVKSLDPESSVQNQESVVVWDGRDATGTVLAPGVYFIRDTNCNLLEKVVKLH